MAGPERNGVEAISTVSLAVDMPGAWEERATGRVGSGRRKDPEEGDPGRKVGGDKKGGQRRGGPLFAVH